MLSFLMGKRKKRGERSRMGNNHSKNDGTGQRKAETISDGNAARNNETNLSDVEKGSEDLTTAEPLLCIDLNQSAIDEFGNEEIKQKDCTGTTDSNTFPTSDNIQDDDICINGSKCELPVCDIKESKEKIEVVVTDTNLSCVNPQESPITCHEREQVLRITRVHSLDSSSEVSQGSHQMDPSVAPWAVAQSEYATRDSGKTVVKSLTDLEKSRKAFFMGLLEDTVEEIYPEDVKYNKPSYVAEEIVKISDPRDPQRPQGTPESSTSVISTQGTNINKDICGSPLELTNSPNLDDAYFAQFVITSNSQLKEDPQTVNFSECTTANDIPSTEEVHSLVLSDIVLESEVVNLNKQQEDSLGKQSFKSTSFDNCEEQTEIQKRDEIETKCKIHTSEGHERLSSENLNFEREGTIESLISHAPNCEVQIFVTEVSSEEDEVDIEFDDEESGIVGFSDVTSLNETSITNTSDEKVTDSGLENDENGELDEILHTELDDISMDEYETAGCVGSESISIDSVITEIKCDNVSHKATEIAGGKEENSSEIRAEEHGGNDVKLDELGEDCVETGEGESDDSPRGGLGTVLPGQGRGLPAVVVPVHCAIPRDEHQVDMLTLSNGAYETFPRSNLSLASSSDESIGTKVKKHVRWADTDDGRSLESYDSYSSASSSEEEVSGSEDEGAGVDEEVKASQEVPADGDDDDDEDETSESEAESDSDEEENKTGAEDTLTESDISVVNVELLHEDIEKIAEDEEEDEEAKMEEDETETKTEKNLVEKIVRLQEELLAKAASLERAQSDLDAAVLEADNTRKKVERLQEELNSLKQRNSQLQCSLDEGSVSSEENGRLESRVRELEQELESVRTERNLLEARLSSLEQERDHEIRSVQQALEDTMKEQTAREARYQKEFETERTLSSQRELQMLEDFEWKLRETEKNAKKKVEGAEAEATRRVHEMEARLARAEADLERLAELKVCEIELKQLKVTSSEQRRTLRHVTRQFEDLQVNEKILQEEVNRLRSALDKEKQTVSHLQSVHKDELAEKERKLRVRLEVQVSQITSEWEDRLRRELAKLKGDLENTHREEKIVAVDMVKLLKEQEIAALKQGWDKKLKDLKQEIADYKQKLEEKENVHRKEIENAQTSSDRDALDLRRKMDKLDMEYQSKIENMQDEHEAELNGVRQECERKIAQMEASYQLQAGTTRTTIELVKQQMVNENQARLERIQAMHRQQMEEQWEMLELEKRNEVRGLEDRHRAALEQLRKELDEIRKAVTPTGGKQGNRQRTPLPESTKQLVIDQLNHEATNPFSCGDLDGIEAVSTGSDAEKILFAKLQQMARQANEDKAEIERLRLRLEEKDGVKQSQPSSQPSQQKQPQHPPHPSRRNRKRRN